MRKIIYAEQFVSLTDAGEGEGDDILAIPGYAKGAPPLLQSSMISAYSQAENRTSALFDLPVVDQEVPSIRTGSGTVNRQVGDDSH